MNTLYLLVILSQNGAGDINASFVNTATLSQCQQKAQMVAGVFIAADILVIENRCIESEWQFSSFEHASSASQIRHFFLITADDKTMQIAPLPDWQSCVSLKKKTLLEARLYCASSVQSVQNNPE
jgi:hypothetical protein